MSKSQREKGKVGERELAKELQRLFPNLSGIRRGQQFNGLDGHDVVGIPGVHIECKRVEKLNVGMAMEQAVNDANDFDVAAVFHRRNRKPWLVTVQLDDLQTLASAVVSAMQ